MHLPHGQQFVPDHPQIGQGKLRHDLRRAFLQTTVAHLHITKLLLEHSERVFHFGSDVIVKMNSVTCI